MVQRRQTKQRDRKKPYRKKGAGRRPGSPRRGSGRNRGQKRRRRFRFRRSSFLLFLLVLLICWFYEGELPGLPVELPFPPVSVQTVDSLEDVPEYSGSPYVILEDNLPDFSGEELTTTSFESYSPLDALGRCGTAYANVGEDLIPQEERGNISSVHPTGWQTAEYDIVDGGYLYNRCHLLGYQLTGENANERNLITGTRYMNVEGMLPFENQVADYIEETDGHVLYRVTPVYSGYELVARGVEMEAYSVEDDGESVCFHVFVYNVQPGIEIDYATGDSWLE